MRAAPSCGCSPPTARKARRLTAGDKDSEPCWSPDGKWIAFAAKRKDDEEPQVYLIAPDGGEARRLASVAGGAFGLRWFPDSKRVAFISWVWPDLKSDQEQAKRRKERKEAKVKAHISERAECRYLGPLAHRRSRAARFRRRRRDRPRPRPARRDRARAPALGTFCRALRHQPRRPRARADRRSQPRAGDDERDRHRRCRRCQRAAPPAVLGQRLERRGTPLFARRPLHRVEFVQRQARLQRPGTTDALRPPRRPHAAPGTQARPRNDATRVGAATAPRCSPLSKIAAGRACTGLASATGCPRRWRPAA